MSLFPAYAQQDAGTAIDMQAVQEVSSVREAELLESDEEPLPAPAAPAPASPPLREDFYLDPKSDYGNLRVSTLYYPGRPQYSRGREEALGQAAAARRGRKRRRYYDAAAEPPRADDELAARQAAFRRLLADAPRDAELWLRFVRFLERCGGGGAALDAAAEAGARVPASRALRAARLRLARLHLLPDKYLELLRDLIAKEKGSALSGELWVRLLDALACSPAACSAQALAAAARAAAARVPAPAYPHLVAAYGSFLRAAGLSELLVMLVELVASMSFPPSDIFPPPADAARTAAAEERLLRLEDAAARSGLPLGARWVRVERARAATHWRAAGALPADELRADPQRAPAPADLADLLLPVAAPDTALLLAAHLLRLAKVPMLPSCGWVRRALGAGALVAEDGCAEALLAQLRAARRLPPAHPAHPSRPDARAAPARLLALLVDPPHYFSDDTGYLSWVNALWAACCSWTRGERRVALLCWWLRWLHALALLADPEEQQGAAELRRLRGVARGALRQWAGGAALPFAQFARLERLCAGAQPAARAADRALRAALRDTDSPHTHRLYVARVAAELQDGPGGLWGVACAVLQSPAPERPGASPPAALLRDALRHAERRCQQVEDELALDTDADEEKPGALVLSALLPGAGEWAAARALLADPARTHQLLQRAIAAPPSIDMSWRALQYREQAATALALAARRRHGLARAAAALAPAHAHCALLALACSGTGASCGGAGEAAARRQTECGALAELLPPMLRALAAPESGPESSAAWRAAARVAQRVARAGGAGATAWAALLEAGARADSPARAALPAATACPAHKWLYVRGAAWSGGEGAALADALLERQLRLHALPDELAAAADALAPPAPPTPPTPPSPPAGQH